MKIARYISLYHWSFVFCFFGLTQVLNFQKNYPIESKVQKFLPRRSLVEKQAIIKITLIEVLYLYIFDDFCWKKMLDVYCFRLLEKFNFQAKCLSGSDIQTIRCHITRYPLSKVGMRGRLHYEKEKNKVERTHYFWI